jgi:GNAT superfamily N-acetyltransferase
VSAAAPTGLPRLLAELDPLLRPGRYVFATAPLDAPVPAEAVASIAEDEGRTLVVPADVADRLGLAAQYPCAWITLRVDSQLAGVGLLARVTAVLAGRGISVNPVSAVHHDHLFVPYDSAAAAMAALRELSARAAPAAASVSSFGEYELDDDPARIDREVVWQFLSTAAYWSRWRSRIDVETQLDRAWRVVGANRRSTGELVGFARAVSDGVSFGYLADVFVLPAARGAGLGAALVESITDDPRVRWVLFTGDAHGLYERFGFAPPDATCLVRPGTH